MQKYLLLDFGATRIKAAAVNIENGIFSKLTSYNAPSNNSKMKGHFEISLSEIKKQFLSICDACYNKFQVPYSGIVICSQMHGFILLDENNKPLSNYISWKDERSVNLYKTEDTFSLIKEELKGSFKRITGMEPRPGFPIMNAMHIARTCKMPSRIKIISLPEWLSLCSGDSKNVVHSTMSAGLGFFDINKGKISKDLVKLGKQITKKEFLFNESVPVGTISGYLHKNNHKIPIYAGVGDHQCAVLGACNMPNKTISINIGTGSQVSIIDKKIENRKVELRPYFKDELLSTITHIPAGRILTIFLGFLEDICINSLKKKADCWDLLGNIAEKDIMRSTLDFDVALFKSAWNYKGGGSITNIDETNLNFKNYLSSLIKCWINQYINAIRVIDPEHRIKKYVLSGGVSKKLPVIANIISNMTDSKVISATDIDETLIGLRTIALISSNKGLNYIEAQNIFGRTCLIN